MDESDSMLITTLRQFINLQANIATLNDIKAEQIFFISLQVLQYLGIDVTQIMSLSGKAQRFRAMAKLNQGLYNQLQTVFQLNELMNPSILFLRKFLLLIINKLGSLENNDKKKKNKSQIKNIKKQEKKELKAWLNEEWIHPSLLTKRPKYKGYILPLAINKNLLKNNLNITSQLNNPLLENNVQSIISTSIAKHNQRVKEFQANQGISRKQMEEAQVKLQNIVRSNKEDWNISSNKLQKIKKKIAEGNVQSTIEAVEANSVFKQQLEQAEIQAQNKKKIQNSKPKEQSKSLSPEELSSLNPLELLKKQAEKKRNQYQNEINDILNALKERKNQIQSWQKEKQSVQNKISTDQQKIIKVKQQTAELKKHVQKRQTILSTLQGQKDIQQQVNKLQGQINSIQAQVKVQVDKITNQTNQLQTESKQKMEALTDLKLKLNKIQNDYERICQEIVEKEQLKGGVKIVKSGISRLYYHKKISEIESRWKEAQRQNKKLKINLIQLRQKTRVSGTLNLRMEIQIQNILNVQKTRNQPEIKALKDILAKCKQTFEKTYKVLQEVNSVKMQTQEYQMKVHSLSGKNYKQNIQKISMAMQQLKKQIYGTKSKAK